VSHKAKSQKVWCKHSILVLIWQSTEFSIEVLFYRYERKKKSIVDDDKDDS